MNGPAKTIAVVRMWKRSCRKPEGRRQRRFPMGVPQIPSALRDVWRQIGWGTAFSCSGTRSRNRNETRNQRLFLCLSVLLSPLTPELCFCFPLAVCISSFPIFTKSFLISPCMGCRMITPRMPLDSGGHKHWWKALYLVRCSAEREACWSGLGQSSPEARGTFHVHSLRRGQGTICKLTGLS